MEEKFTTLQLINIIKVAETNNIKVSEILEELNRFKYEDMQFELNDFEQLEAFLYRNTISLIECRDEYEILNAHERSEYL